MRPLATLFMCFFAFSCGNTHRASSHLDNSSQVILSIAESDSTHTGMLFSFERSGNGWHKAFFFPIVLGKNGLAWGIGLHKDSDRDPTEPVKREGDGKSPMGAFELLHAYGYMPPEMVDTRIPYKKSCHDLICINDVESEYYNMVVNLREKGLDPKNLPSHETMIRRDNLYKYTIFVGHNTKCVDEEYIAIRFNAGSCIFLHLWRNENSFTDGCTAMSEANMLKLLAWLDPEKNPILVQLTRKSYERLRDRWGLPGIHEEMLLNKASGSRRPCYLQNVRLLSLRILETISSLKPVNYL